jgi:tRNA dimethylallyltransferase
MRLTREALALGPETLHARLRMADAATAARVSPRDTARIVRALEVVTLTGHPMSAAIRRHSESASASRFRVLMIGLTLPRQALDERLNARVDRLLAEGLRAEVQALLDLGLPPHLPAMQGIGYRHLAPVILRGAPLEGAVAVMKRDTRRYARRQWTWFAREPVDRWLTVDPSRPHDTVAALEKVIEESGIFR